MSNGLRSSSGSNMLSNLAGKSLNLTPSKRIHHLGNNIPLSDPGKIQMTANIQQMLRLNSQYRFTQRL